MVENVVQLQSRSGPFARRHAERLVERAARHAERVASSA
jgi:hypothetical protein